MIYRKEDGSVDYDRIAREIESTFEPTEQQKREREVKERRERTILFWTVLTGILAMLGFILALLTYIRQT